MSLVLDGAGPPPHLLQSKSSVSWPCSYNPHEYPAPTSPPAPMSPQSLHSYMSHLPESPLSSQELSNLPTSTWYGPSVSAPDCHNQVRTARNGYTAYGQYMTPQTSSMTLSSNTASYSYAGKAPMSTKRIETSVVALSPVSVHTRDNVVPRSRRPSEEPQVNPTRAIEQPSARWIPNSHLLERPHSSSSSLHSGPVDPSWAMSPLGIQPVNMPHDQYYSTFQHLARSPRLSEPLMEVPSNHLSSPQSRRLYTPIAPQPLEAPRSSGLKRTRDEDEEANDEIKRRKRSDSNTSAQFELSEEDKLLLQLKEEESMPWKDIAARFQSDLGKSYQIPALQMRLKRLRERMRVWTDTDVRALRMAHEYWVQNKFDIISQKMLEFGAQEKWTARQCARKWAEIDPAPTPYAHFEQHLQQGFAPYTISPVEAPHSFQPFMNVQ
ncbi:hypothetical protein GQ44DRAFT_660264 [Phaeosphaeriaceae sp. PMI808]|nr:hypothetical protein GQ44DRAFT_660264 [Phaeosphaeriaceae sp. PMI808]